jgi:hypothetical protein
MMRRKKKTEPVQAPMCSRCQKYLACSMIPDTDELVCWSCHQEYLAGIYASPKANPEPFLSPHRPRDVSLRSPHPVR